MGYYLTPRDKGFWESISLKMLAAYHSGVFDSADLIKGCKIKEGDTFQESKPVWHVVYEYTTVFEQNRKTGHGQIFKEGYARRTSRDIWITVPRTDNYPGRSVWKDIRQNWKQFFFPNDEWNYVMWTKYVGEILLVGINYIHLESNISYESLPPHKLGASIFRQPLCILYQHHFSRMSDIQPILIIHEIQCQQIFAQVPYVSVRTLNPLRHTQFFCSFQNRE